MARKIGTLTPRKPPKGIFTLKRTLVLSYLKFVDEIETKLAHTHAHTHKYTKKKKFADLIEIHMRGRIITNSYRNCDYTFNSIHSMRVNAFIFFIYA